MTFITAARNRRAAAAEQVKQQEVKATFERRGSIRKTLMARSQLRAQAQALGAGGSSAAAGGLGSISSQLGANLGFSNQMSGLSTNITNYTAKAQEFEGYTSLLMSAASL